MGISTEGYEFLCFPKKLILDTIFQTSLSSNARNRIIAKIRCSLGSILDTKVLQSSGIWGNIYEEIDNSFCNLAEWNHTVSYHLIFRNYCCQICKYNWSNYLVTQLYVCTVKLGNKERFDKEQIGIKELFMDYQPFYSINLLLDKELLPI